MTAVMIGIERELDISESMLSSQQFEQASTGAETLLRKLLVVPGGERYEPAAACVLIQAFCARLRLDDAITKLRSIYGDLLDAPIDALLVLASFLLDFNRPDDAQKLLLGALLRNMKKRNGNDVTWTAEQRAIFTRFYCVEVLAKSLNDTNRATQWLQQNLLSISVLHQAGIADELLELSNGFSDDKVSSQLRAMVLAGASMPSPLPPPPTPQSTSSPHVVPTPPPSQLTSSTSLRSSQRVRFSLPRVPSSASSRGGVASASTSARRNTPPSSSSIPPANHDGSSAARNLYSSSLRDGNDHTLHNGHDDEEDDDEDDGYRHEEDEEEDGYDVTRKYAARKSVAPPPASSSPRVPTDLPTPPPPPPPPHDAFVDVQRIVSEALVWAGHSVLAVLRPPLAVMQQAARRDDATPPTSLASIPPAATSSSFDAATQSPQQGSKLLGAAILYVLFRIRRPIVSLIKWWLLRVWMSVRWIVRTATLISPRSM